MKKPTKMQPSNDIKNLFISKFLAVGEEQFYQFLISYALNRLVDTPITKKYNPANELLEFHDMFLKLFRRENDEIYLNLSIQFRKAAHKIYRIGLARGLLEVSNKYLTLVK